MSGRMQLKGKGRGLAITLVTQHKSRLEPRSALQSQKWQMVD